MSWVIEVSRIKPKLAQRQHKYSSNGLQRMHNKDQPNSVANMQSQKLLCSGKLGPSLPLCSPLCTALNSKVRRKTGSTRVLALSGAGLLSLGKQSQLSSGCSNPQAAATRHKSFIIGFLAILAPADLGCSRDSDPKCPVIHKVLLYLKSFRSHFPLLTLSCRKKCCPGQN